MIKNAFAMRSNLGDSGVCGVGQQPGSGLCFQDMENLTSAMLSPATLTASSVLLIALLIFSHAQISAFLR